MTQKKMDSKAKNTNDVAKDNLANVDPEKIQQIFKDFTMQRTQEVFGQDFIQRHGFTQQNITMKDVINAKGKELEEALKKGKIK